jgi:hypothetical protein
MKKDLELFMTGPAGIRTVGAIFCYPTPDDAQPLVDNVAVRSSNPKPLKLAPGRYEYEFAVDVGSGKFSLWIREQGNKTGFAKKTCDTSLGTDGLVFNFQVLP